jgi:hypothetical protein
VGKGCGIAETAGRLAQKQPSFKECVIAHQSSDPAPKMVGTFKHATEATDGAFRRFMVGERSPCSEAEPEGSVERGEVKMPE